MAGAKLRSADPAVRLARRHFFDSQWLLPMGFSRKVCCPSPLEGRAGRHLGRATAFLLRAEDVEAAMRDMWCMRGLTFGLSGPPSAGPLEGRVGRHFRPRRARRQRRRLPTLADEVHRACCRPGRAHRPSAWHRVCLHAGLAVLQSKYPHAQRLCHETAAPALAKCT